MLAGDDRASVFAYWMGPGIAQDGVLGKEARSWAGSAAEISAAKRYEVEAVQMELLADSLKVGASSSAKAWLNLLRPVGFAGALQRPDLGVDPHDDGVQRDFQIIRFFRGAQAPRERAGLIQLRPYLLQDA